MYLIFCISAAAIKVTENGTQALESTKYILAVKIAVPTTAAVLLIFVVIWKLSSKRKREGKIIYEYI